MPIPQRRIAPRRGRTAPQRGRRGAPSAGSGPVSPALPALDGRAGGSCGGGAARWLSLAARAAALALLVATLAAAGRAGAVELKIEAPSFTFDSDRRIYRYQEARISMGDMSLEAQEVVINERAGTLTATGGLRMRSGHLFISADRLDLDVQTQNGVVTNARVYDSQSGYYLKAAAMNVQPGRILAARCTLTSCPPLVPGWKLVVSDLDYRADDFAVGRNTLMEFGEVPVFWMPYLAWPTVAKRRSGVLAPEISSRTASLSRFNLGTRAAVPYFLDLGTSQDLTLTPEYIEFRGTALTADYRYAFHGDQIGELRLWGVAEDIKRNPAGENDILAPGQAERQSSNLTRYTFDYGHNEGIGDSGRFLLSATGSSDGQVRREYEYVENYRPELIYQGTYSHQASWGDSAVSVEHASEYNVESLYANNASFANGPNRPLLAPRISYGQGWRPFEAVPLGVEFTGAATRFQTDADVSGDALFARPALEVPLQLGPGVELHADVARQFAEYDELTGKDQFTGLPVPPSEGFGQTESHVELRGTLAGVYNPATGIYDAVKHRVIPRLIYDAVEDVRQPLADRLLRGRLAEQLLTFRLDNVFIGELRNKPPAPVTDYQPTNLSASNRFDFLRQNESAFASVPNPRDAQRGATEEFAHVDFIQRYNFLLESKTPSLVGPALPAVQEATPGNPLLPAILEAGYSRGGLGLSLETHFSYQEQHVTETIIGMSASLKPYMSLGIGYTQNEFSYRTPENKLHPVGNYLSANGSVAMTDTLSFSFAETVNLLDVPAPLGQRVQSSQYFLDYHPLCYRIRFGVSNALGVTQTSGVYRYFTSQTVMLEFTIGNFFSTSHEQIVSAGAPR